MPGNRSEKAFQEVVGELLRQWKRERPDLDASAMAVVGRILRLGKKLEVRANEVLKPHALGYTELDVLATLRRFGKPYALKPSQLQRHVLISSGAMTACLNRLEGAGFITRIATTDDRRALVAALTPAGRALIDRAIAARFAEASDAINGLTSSERKQLAQLLQKLEAGLSAIPRSKRAAS